MRLRLLTCVCLVALAAPSVRAQTTQLDGALDLLQQVRVVPNVVYLKANNWQGRLDVYARRDPAPAPTLIYIHGGGWVGGSKEGSALNVLPYVAMGFAVVNVEYRLAEVSLAPAAVEDCRCALRWVTAHAKDYNLDISRLVIAGNSAGGHLALTTGMIPGDAGFDRQCLSPTAPKASAIVNFYGIADVADLLEGPNKKPFPENGPYTVWWLGNATDREALAKRVSPITYVRAGQPPVISVHGDADPTVPYNHSVRLHDALKKAGVPNELVTIAGGKHGGFTLDENRRAFAAIRAFLVKNGVLTATSTSQ